MNKLSYDDYKVGWICALDCEFKAALLMLDQEYPPLTPSPGDNNTYTFGRIGMHNVVIVSLPASITGTNAAARVATEMRRTFPLIFGLMVGIAGGIPSDKHDIRLGDVVVSEPSGRFGGVVEYDFGKTVSNGKFQRSLRHLNRPSDLLLSALPKAKAYTHGGGSEIMRYYQETLSRHPEAESFSTRPGHDVLFDSDYDDPEPNSSCAKCDKKFIIHRSPRASNVPVVHYGLIASGNQVMRHGQTRDQLREVADVLCYEMEAAGLMDTSPFLIIRGICDYADTHKEKSWQNYAAVMAAAYAKHFLSVLQPRSPGRPRVKESEMEIARLWLSPNVQRTFHDNLADMREAKTGEWFMYDSLFEKWMQPDTKSILWLTGIPGAGKSILASNVVDYLDGFCKDSPGKFGLAYFYCTYRDEKAQEIQHIAASLVSQLARQSPIIAQSLIDHHKERTLAPEIYKNRPIETDILCKILQRGLEDLETTFIVIDALDECHESSMVTKWLLNIYRDTKFPLKILMTSREEENLIKCLEPYPKISLSDHNQGDIEIYLTTQIEAKVGQQPGWCSDEMREKILRKITEMAGNMFQLAAYQWNIISEECYNYAQIEDSLDTLPRTIDGVYRRILEKLELRTGKFKERRNILQWLAGSKRTLKLEELAEAVFIEDGQKWWDKSTVANQPEKLARLCGSLVDFNKQTKEVSLCHFSLKEFLTSDRIFNQRHEPEDGNRYSSQRLSNIAKYHLDSQETHRQLAKNCLTYLLFEDFKVSYMDRAHLDRTRQKYSLLDYATVYVGEHLRELETCDDELAALLDKLFLPELTIESFTRPDLKKQLASSTALCTVTIYCPPVQKDADHEYCGTYTSPNAIFRGWKPREKQKPFSWNLATLMASLWKWLSSFRNLGYIFRQSTERQALDKAKIMAEHYVTLYSPRQNSRAWLQLYRILTPNKDHHDNITPLYFTGLFNWRAGVSRYIENGANRALTSDLNHALRGAAIGGSLREEEKEKCKSIIQLLLNAGAEVDSHTPGLGSALQAAAYCGNLEATNALLEAGAPSHEENSFYRPGGTVGSALQAAAMSGNQPLAKALIDNGAPINNTTGWVGTPLCSVLERGMFKMSCFLLDNGARPDIIGGYFVSSLHLSARTSFVLEEILEKVENVDVNLFPYGTALQTACDAKNFYAVEKLLARSADVHAPVGQFGTAIQAACWSGSPRVVTALLRSGANADSPGMPLVTHADQEITIPYYGKTVLLIGGQGLHDQWIHDHWDDLFPKIGFYGLSLAGALRIREPVHNKVLALFEFEPTHQEGHYGDSLHVAAFRGHFQIVETLLEHSTKVNSICGVFGTALEAAAYAGHHEIVEILLKNDADPSTQAGFYGLPLLAATVSGNSRICDILLQAGADPNASDEHGWTRADWQRHMGTLECDGNRGRPILPSQWGTGWFKSPQLAVGEDGDDLHFLGSPLTVGTELSASAMANHPLPPGTDWYFEFTVTSSGDTGKLAVGVSDGLMPRFQLPGHYMRSWGYEGSTGQCWGQKAIIHSYPPFETGDVVGCGFRFKDRRLYFTRNGEKQLPEIEVPLIRLFPTVGMCSQGACGRFILLSP